jgi:hypothetical protein
MYYGKRYPAEDGSYVTTLWVTAVYVPLIPLGSYRVLPVGKGTNIIVHSSQTYQSMRVPLCWPQVRNVFIWLGPIVLLILYLYASDIRQWWKEDVLKSRTPQHLALEPEPQPEPQQAQPSEADLPLDSKAAAVACGQRKLDESGFVKLDIIPRLNHLVHDSGFTDRELNELTSEKATEEQAFHAYSLAYLTWDKPAQFSRAQLDKMVIDVVSSVDMKSLSSAERAEVEVYLAKFKRMMLKAFDLGRHDARLSPCPF